MQEERKKFKKFKNLKFKKKKKGQDPRRFFEKAGKNRRTNGRNKVLSKRLSIYLLGNGIMLKQ